MELCEYFPFWDELSLQDRKLLLANTTERTLTKGSILINSQKECLGLIAVANGIIRAFITSENGREITLYKLHKNEICLFTAKCAFNEMNFDVQLEALEPSTLHIINPQIYKSIMDSNAPAASFTNSIMSKRFSTVMSLMEQILFYSFDKRLEEYLEKEAVEQNTRTLKLTHDRIARDLGSAREVVSRMLKHFEDEDKITLSRGLITLK